MVILGPCMVLQYPHELRRDVSSLEVLGLLHQTIQKSQKVVQKLAHCGIESWSDLKNQFIDMFTTGNPGLALVRRIHDMKQETCKLLKSYQCHFTQKILEGENIPQEIAFQALKLGSDQMIPFWRDICYLGPTSYNELVDLIKEDVSLG
ncbi:Uncharacterized protein Adt_05853 [Abeliophyllum distichum]|uniref:Uncharacterized protein n=1 Tax=Abeliophyllum distichum TaxID=126358 RepID=A0ABD1V5A1_9LAMI